MSPHVWVNFRQDGDKRVSVPFFYCLRCGAREVAS